VKAKRDGQCLSSESGLTDGSHAGVMKELAEEGESGTISISSVQERDEFD